MFIDVILEAYDNYTLQFPRQSLCDICLLIRTILELDLTTEKISIPTKDVTPETLGLLLDIITKSYLPTEITIDVDMILKSSRYLQSDILEVLADPTYLLFRKIYPDINLLHIDKLPDIYNVIMGFAIKTGSTYLVKYLYSYSAPDRIFDRYYFEKACELGLIEQVKLGLKRIENPQNGFIEAIQSIRIHIVSLLLQDSRIILDDSTLKSAIMTDYYPLIQLIADSPKMTSDKFNSGLCEIGEHVNMLQLLIHHPKADLTYNNYGIFRMTYIGGHERALKMLLDVSRIGPNCIMLEIFKYGVVHGEHQILELKTSSLLSTISTYQVIISHPQFNISTFLEDSHKIVIDFIQHNTLHIERVKFFYELAIQMNDKSIYNLLGNMYKGVSPPIWID